MWLSKKTISSLLLLLMVWTSVVPAYAAHDIELCRMILQATEKLDQQKDVDPLPYVTNVLLREVATHAEKKKLLTELMTELAGLGTNALSSAVAEVVHQDVAAGVMKDFWSKDIKKLFKSTPSSKAAFVLKLQQLFSRWMQKLALQQRSHVDFIEKVLTRYQQQLALASVENPQMKLPFARADLLLKTLLNDEHLEIRKAFSDILMVNFLCLQVAASSFSQKKFDAWDEAAVSFVGGIAPVVGAMINFLIQAQNEKQVMPAVLLGVAMMYFALNLVFDFSSRLCEYFDIGQTKWHLMEVNQKLKELVAAEASTHGYAQVELGTAPFDFSKTVPSLKDVTKAETLNQWTPLQLLWLGQQEMLEISALRDQYYELLTPETKFLNETSAVARTFMQSIKTEKSPVTAPWDELKVYELLQRIKVLRTKVSPALHEASVSEEQVAQVLKNMEIAFDNFKRDVDAALDLSSRVPEWQSDTLQNQNSLLEFQLKSQLLKWVLDTATLQKLVGYKNEIKRHLEYRQSNTVLITNELNELEKAILQVLNPQTQLIPAKLEPAKKQLQRALESWLNHFG